MSVTNPSDWEAAVSSKYPSVCKRLYGVSYVEGKVFPKIPAKFEAALNCVNIHD